MKEPLMDEPCRRARRFSRPGAWRAPCGLRTRPSRASIAGRSRSARSTRPYTFTPYADQGRLARAGPVPARAGPGERRPLADAGEAPAQRPRLRPHRARRLLRREGLLREPPGLLRHRQPLPARSGRPGPFPGVLSPHGHWAYGRLENGADGSIPARCISLARQGYVVFSYDMVGYNDSRQVDHRLLDARLAQWGIGSLGAAPVEQHPLGGLPGVAPRRRPGPPRLHRRLRRRHADLPADRGGRPHQGLRPGQHDLALHAGRGRLRERAEPAPRHEQHGDRRAHGPAADADGLGGRRLDARHAARSSSPRSRASTRCWGRRTRVATVQFIADHNYNRDSREAVYALVRTVGPREGPTPRSSRRRSTTAELPSDLLVFFGRELPKEAKTQPQIVEALIAGRRAQLAALRPRDAAGPRALPRGARPGAAPRRGRRAPRRRRGARERRLPPASKAGARDLVVGRRGRGDRVPVRLWAPPAGAGRATLVVHPDGVEGASAHEASLVEPLRRRGHLVAVDRRLQHRARPGAARHERPLLHDLQPHGRRQPGAGHPHRSRLAEAAARRPRRVPRRPRAGRAVVPPGPGARARPRTPSSPTPTPSRRRATRPISTGSPFPCSAAWAASRRP